MSIEVRPCPHNPDDFAMTDVTPTFVGNFVSPKGRSLQFIPLNRTLRGELSTQVTRDASPGLMAVGMIPGHQIIVDEVNYVVVIRDLLANKEHADLRKLIAEAANTEAMSYNKPGYVMGPEIIKFSLAEQWGTLLWYCLQMIDKKTLVRVEGELPPRDEVLKRYPVRLSEKGGIGRINSDDNWNFRGQIKNIGALLHESKTPKPGGNPGPK